MISRAPTSAVCGYSASAPTMATVCGLGVCFAASSKNPVDGPAEQPALLVDLVLPDLHGEQRGLAVGGEPARQGHAEADPDRVGRAGDGDQPDGRDEDERGDDDADQSPGTVHGFLRGDVYYTRRLPWHIVERG